jgi:EmrB/QacA subfamily drug resistance transporter
MRRRLLTDETRRWWTVGALALSIFTIMLDSTVVSVALPAIQRDLQIDLTELEWTVNAYTLVFAVLLLLGGKLADFFGRRRILLVGLAIFTLASVACALAPSGGALIAGRAAQGIGAALIMPATLSIIAATFPPEKRGAAIGIWASASLLAVALGPLTGGLIIKYLSWTWIFYINIPTGAVAMTTARAVISESRDPGGEKRLDIPGLVASAAALFGLTFGLIEGNAFGWGSPEILVSLIGAGVAFALFVLLERYRPRPMLDLALFRNATFAGANVVGLLAMVGIFAVFFFMSIFMQLVLGYSAVEAGATFLPMTLLIVVITPLAGRLTDRIGPRWLMTIGMTLVAVSLFLFSRLDADAGFWTMLPGLLIGGLGLGLTAPPMMAAVLGSVPVAISGLAGGVLSAFRLVGGALGIALTGAIVAAQVGDLRPGDPRFGPAFVDGFQTAMLFGAAAAFAAVPVAALMIGKTRRLVAGEPAGAGI